MKTPGSGEERKGDGLREMKVSSAKRVQSRGSLQGQAAKRADEVGQARRNRNGGSGSKQACISACKGQPQPAPANHFHE